ncbi:dTDP-4-dehydrorhamnose 3,5-epimerase [Bacillus safensis]|uniref:dTDP-4-dehydrorhamnose 3,5-epimerase n=1 Tax=Bacillus safensis TaxID=561879 RepID=UPI0004D40FB1|nr:dTDP-4-dehydrorhamnose 3,5-epimerase [Bacillus safensis]KEP30518.1 dTDP-4-dehydrorhamnose 3,5-epimerase [Bacillus safensis]MED1460483.1 dTDP-4-dehydrorhamnose 3,5-epimerase [Bacillus safensis]
MRIYETELESVFVIETDIYHDARGYFSETYNQRDFNEAGINVTFKQDNHSFSKDAGVLRGLHYQEPPFAQSKLLRVISGAIYDVIVDIRPKSPTFGKWISVILTAENKKQVFVPKGFAHGFCTLTSDTNVLYKTDAYYSKKHEYGIRWNDPYLNIRWPVKEPILSKKDERLPLFKHSSIVGGDFR